MFDAYHRMCLAAYLLATTVMMVITATPFYIFDVLGGEEAMSGAVGAAMAAAYAGMCLLSSRFVLRTRNGLTWALAGALGFTVVSVQVPFHPNPWVCGVLSALAHGVLAFAWPALHAWVGSEPDPRIRARRMIWFNVSWSAGFATGPLYAGPLYALDYHLPFLALIVTGGGAALFIRSVPHESRYFGEASPEILDARRGHDALSEAYLYAAWLACLTANILAGVLRAVYPKRVDDLVSAAALRVWNEAAPPRLLTVAPATKYAWLYFALALTTALCFPLLGRTSFWHHRFRYLFAVQLAAGGAFWLLGHTQSLAVMIVCYAVCGAALGVCFFASTYYCMADPAIKHRRTAINEGVVGTGALIGSLGYGFLAEAYGIAMPMHWTLVLVVLVLAVQYALIHVRARGLERG